jgi:hypothetical protein
MPAASTTADTPDFSRLSIVTSRPIAISKNRHSKNTLSLTASLIEVNFAPFSIFIVTCCTVLMTET